MDLTWGVQAEVLRERHINPWAETTRWEFRGGRVMIALCGCIRALEQQKAKSNAELYVYVREVRSK